MSDELQAKADEALDEMQRLAAACLNSQILSPGMSFHSKSAGLKELSRCLRTFTQAEIAAKVLPLSNIALTQVVSLKDRVEQLETRVGLASGAVAETPEAEPDDAKALEAAKGIINMMRRLKPEEPLSRDHCEARYDAARNDIEERFRAYTAGFRAQIADLKAQLESYCIGKSVVHKKYHEQVVDDLKAKLATAEKRELESLRERDGWKAQFEDAVHGYESAKAAPAASVDPERVAQLIAHRACCGVEHDPVNGKLHGACIVCGVPWPCEYAGKPPQVEVATATPGQGLSEEEEKTLQI